MQVLSISCVLWVWGRGHGEARGGAVRGLESKNAGVKRENKWPRGHAKKQTEVAGAH